MPLTPREARVRDQIAAMLGSIELHRRPDVLQDAIDVLRRPPVVDGAAHAIDEAGAATIRVQRRIEAPARPGRITLPKPAR